MTAAVVIQRHWRGFLSRRKTAELLKAVLDIQRWWKVRWGGSQGGTQGGEARRGKCVAFSREGGGGVSGLRQFHIGGRNEDH